MIWWVSLPGRAREERAQLAELQERCPWLVDVVWHLESDFKLTASFAIVREDDRIAFTLTYPDFFPDVPPSVRPKDATLLSPHQYGAGGELCLEYRADNWRSDTTGAMLVESAYRLLVGEEDAQAAPVPSAHKTTLGQEVRGETMRFALADEARQNLLALPPGHVLDAEITELRHADAWVAQVTRLGEKDAPIFARSLPRDPGYTKWPALAFRLPDGERIPRPLTPDKLLDLVGRHGLDAQFEVLRNKGFAFLILVSGQTICLPGFFGGKEMKVLEYRTILSGPARRRLPERFSVLTDKRVGIVGCGSLGSKVAVSLARSGVSGFALIDPDLLFPDNVVRNDLDLRAVGVNKSQALKNRLLEIAPDAEVIARSVLLGGQESADTTASVMDLLSKCDLIVDATAEPTVFNLCASVAKAESKPMLWGEVFAGGVGGLVARSAPDHDPPPQRARNQILSWYASRDVPWTATSPEDYAVDVVDAAPLVASDADVGAIAGHLTQFALDLLVNTNGSDFPYSAYVLGFKAEWIFSGPYETYPITYSPDGSWGPDHEADAATEVGQLLKELFPTTADAD